MKTLPVILAVTLIAGCASSGVKVDQSKVSAFERGVTTRAQIETALGRPTSAMVMRDGKTVLTYTFANAQVRPESFIPIVGMFAGGTDVRAESVTVYLDEHGLYDGADSVASEFGAATGLAAGKPQPRLDQPRAPEPR
ncbi:MAG: hypothetical protein LDL19_00205 [Thiobacillus sp.]|nr:hypothetical protein [Thiobacillus sp.]